MPNLVRMVSLCVLGVLLLTGAQTVRAEDPMSGKWEINLAKSKYDPGPPPQYSVRVHEFQDDTISVILDMVSASGKPRHVEFVRKLDGQEYPDSDDPHADTIAWKRIDARTLEFTQKTAGKTTEEGRLQVSDDAKQLTLNWKGRNNKGETFDNVAVFDKVMPRGKGRQPGGP
jgi:hypothetical protein